jgi:RIO kinase 1
MSDGDDDFVRLERQVHDLKLTRSLERSSEGRKVVDEVFDRRTMLSIYKLMKIGLVDQLDFPISTGKEANVFRVSDEDGEHYALKIFRTTNASFNSISKYIEGDSRFKGLTGSKYKLIMAWCIKEFKNLSRAMEAKIKVPEPIRFQDNMLLMQYLGTEEMPAPSLKQIELEDPVGFYKDVVSMMGKAYRKAELVHGDLSEYNILLHEGSPYIIDWGQAMTTEHPNHMDFLKRDIVNVNRFFRSWDVKVLDDEAMLKKIVGVKKNASDQSS